MKIFPTLRRNHIHQQEHVSQSESPQATPLNMARYTKAVSSTLWIQVTLAVCYLPYAVAIVLTPRGELPQPYYLVRNCLGLLLFT